MTVATTIKVISFIVSPPIVRIFMYNAPKMAVLEALKKVSQKS